MSFLSRPPGHLVFIPFPFLYVYTLWWPDTLVDVPIWVAGLYVVYYTLVVLYSLGCWLLYFVHQSPYKDAVTKYLGGGRFLFNLLGSPDPRYGNQRDHIFRTGVVPFLTLGLVLSIHIIRVCILVFYALV